MFREIVVILRALLKQPAFTCATIGTLALGIAAPTALFSTVHAALLRPLPYPSQENIYSVRTRITDGRYTSGLVAAAELSGLREADAVLHATGAYPLDATLLSDGGPIRATGYAVWRGFFDLFGVPMTLGRGFIPEEHAGPGPNYVILSHRIWRTAYGADPAIVGKSVRVPGHTALVVGVAGPSFDVPSGADFWLNLRIPPHDIGHTLLGYVRLRPGATPKSLQTRMDQVMQALAVKHPDQNKNRVFVMTPMLDAIVGDLAPILLIVFAATVLLLALACVNVTNLMIARAAVRAREMAIRTALGASVWRIVRYSFVESLLLAVIGGGVGLLGAYAGVRLLAWMGASQLARLENVTLDPPVLVFAICAVIGTGLFVGVAPAMRSASADAATTMNEGGRSATGSWRTRRLLGALVAIEVALGLALLASTGRMVRSYSNLRNTDPGFTQENRLIADILLPPSYNDPRRHAVWYGRVADEIRAAGASRVAAASSLPLRTEWDTTTFVDFVNDPATDPHKRPNGRLRIVSADFFSMLGIRLVKGRFFTARDGYDAPGAAIVNEAFVRTFLSGRDPIGERVTIPGFRGRMVDGRPHFEPATIVGVVSDVRYAALHAPAEQTVYLADPQRPMTRKSLVISTLDGAPERLTAQVRAVLHTADPEVSVEFDTTREVLGASLRRQRLGMVLMVLFGVTALLLMSVGVLGVTGYLLAERRGELAVRAALGASRAQLLREVFGRGARLVAVGLGAGVVLAWWSGGVMAAYVYEVRPADLLVIGSSCAAVLAAAFLAMLLPARRATAIDPSRVLRSS